MSENEISTLRAVSRQQGQLVRVVYKYEQNM